MSRVHIQTLKSDFDKTIKAYINRIKYAGQDFFSRFRDKAQIAGFAILYDKSTQPTSILQHDIVASLNCGQTLLN